MRSVCAGLGCVCVATSCSTHLFLSVHFKGNPPPPAVTSNLFCKMLQLSGGGLPFFGAEHWCLVQMSNVPEVKTVAGGCCR